MQNRQIEFYIRSAELSDLDSIQKIYQSARDFMKANGNSTQWGNDRPHKKNIESNISKKIQFICCYKNENGTEEGRHIFVHARKRTFLQRFKRRKVAGKHRRLLVHSLCRVRNEGKRRRFVYF